MDKRLLELLNAKFLGKGVRKDGLEQLASSLSMTVSTDEEAQALVDKLTDEQVTAFVKDWRKVVDSEVNRGVETFRKKNEKTDDPAPPDPTPAGGEASNDPQDIATMVQNAVKAAVEPLQQKLSAFEGQTVAERRNKAFTDALANAPESFKEKAVRDFARMNFKDDEDFAAFVTDTENDLAKFNQELSDRANGGYRRPMVGSGGSGGKEEEPSAGVKQFLAERSSEGGNGGLGGKEV